MIEKFGKFNTEKDAELSEQARMIVNEILNFGITQRQLMIIIHSLAMNIENVEKMQVLTATIREIDNDSFIIDSKDGTNG